MARLVQEVPGVHVWAAGIHDVTAPALRREVLQLPLRSAPAVVREVAAGIDRLGASVLPYVSSGAAAPTDGPPPFVIRHHGAGHAGGRPDDCRQCGEETAAQLARLGVGSQGELPQAPCWLVCWTWTQVHRQTLCSPRNQEA